MRAWLKLIPRGYRTIKSNTAEILLCSFLGNWIVNLNDDKLSAVQWLKTGRTSCNVNQEDIMEKSPAGCWDPAVYILDSRRILWYCLVEGNWNRSGWKAIKILTTNASSEYIPKPFYSKNAWASAAAATGDSVWYIGIINSYWNVKGEKFQRVNCSHDFTSYTHDLRFVLFKALCQNSLYATVFTFNKKK